MAAEAPSVEETLAWEAQWRPRAAAAAILAGVLNLAGGIAASLVYRDLPSVSIPAALRDAAGTAPASGGLKTAQVLWFDDHIVVLTLISLALAIGGLALAGPLLYLFRAAKARRPGLTPLARPAAIAGPIIIALATIAYQVGLDLSAHSFAGSADHTTSAAHDALQTPPIVAALILRQLAVLVLGLGFVIVCLNAMRVGLLTRFMGVLGVIVGVLFVIPLGSSLPVVQSFWLIAIGVMILGRWPSGTPPAWLTGRAEPWPSRQQLLEARQADGDDDAGGPTVPAAEEDPQQLPDGSARPRKKKRRR